MAMEDASEALAAMKHLQRQELSIIRLSQAITDPADDNPRQRASDASTSLSDGLTPASLEADLTNYMELFVKLRFSYVEQVTKEKFLRAIVGDPPLIVTMQENLDLERQNAEAKAQLKSLKLQVASLVAELEKRGRELSQRYEAIQVDTATLEELPSRIQELEARVGELRSRQHNDGIDPISNLPLAKTQSLVARREAERQDLARELAALQAKLLRREKEAERLRAELGPLEARAKSSTAAAREAQKSKEDRLGGAADDMEQRARWWRASEDVLQKVLGLES